MHRQTTYHIVFPISGKTVVNIHPDSECPMFRSMPDFVINRTRDPEVSLFYECHGVLVFHSSDIVHTGNDKAVTLQKLKQKWSAKIPLQIQKSTVIELTQYAVDLQRVQVIKPGTDPHQFAERIYANVFA